LTEHDAEQADEQATGPPARTAVGGGPDSSASLDRLRLPAHLESLPRFRELALAWAERAGLGQEAVQRLDLVLEEMLMNVFHHAYPGQLGDVELALLSSRQALFSSRQDNPRPEAALPGRLSLTLTDWGLAFDPLAPTRPAQAGGLADGLTEGLVDGLAESLEEGQAEASFDDLEAQLEANLEAGLDERELGGMGLFLLRTLAQAAYERRGNANVLTLTFGP